MKDGEILGLDISTSIIGVCVLDKEGDLVELDHITLNKVKTGIYDKANIVKAYLESLKKRHNIKRVYAEESLLRFRHGFSSAKTLSLLQKMNGIVSYISHEIFGVNPEHILAPHARKTIGITIDKKEKKEKGIKIIILNHVQSILGEQFKVDYTKNGTHKPHMYDRADAWVMARAGFIKNETD